jgi:hypothetical protein
MPNYSASTSIPTNTDQAQETVCDKLTRMFTSCLVTFGPFAVPREYPHYCPGDDRGLPEPGNASGERDATNTPG